MPLVPGLVPNIRIPAPDAAASPGGISVNVDESPQDGDDVPEFDDSGAVVRIEHGDGSVTVSLDGKPLNETGKKSNKGWFDNLVDDIDDAELARIADDLLRALISDAHQDRGRRDHRLVAADTRRQRIHGRRRIVAQAHDQETDHGIPKSDHRPGQGDRE